MRRVLLLQLDGKMPNLALMRLAAHYRALDHVVVLRHAANVAAVQPYLDDPEWDHVYASLIFESTRPLARHVMTLYPSVILGGTGWNLTTTLEELGIGESLDYSDYPRHKQSIGFAMRGCRLKCDFCVVPRKEGKARSAATIAEIWRGAPWPAHIVLLDNDLFGNPNWPSIIDELNAGKFKVCYCQGINARFLEDETAAAIASTDYRDGKFDARRIYTAWDGKRDEKRLFRGLDFLTKYGVKPDHIMAYILVGHEPGETHADRDYRRAKLRDYGVRPYPMPFDRSHDEVVGFQRWVIGSYDKRVSWADWKKAKYDPRKLGDRRVSLPLFQEES